MTKKTEGALCVFAVYDSKSDAYMNPFVMHTAPQAVRSFTKVALDPEHDFHAYGADYTLFELGTWDPQRGVLERHDQAVNHGNALQHRVAYEQQMAAATANNGEPKLAVMGGE